MFGGNTPQKYCAWNRFDVGEVWGLHFGRRDHFVYIAIFSSLRQPDRLVELHFRCKNGLENPLKSFSHP